MTLKCALIVDDSRTAQEALGRVLAANRLRVETASSAEEALEYLSRSRPDVIFMDHNMPGMDGLQAVQAIKNNPATATIPIMMYTSQEGELYVGQARALGAVGVLPKQIKPVEVSDVLKSLHLLDGAPPGVAAIEASGSFARLPPAAGAVHDMSADLNARDWTDLHRWLQEMFEHQGHEIRQDIETTVVRVLREQPAPVRADPPPVPAPQRRSPLTTALLVVLTSLAGLFLWLHLDTQQKWRAAVEQNASLMATLTAGRAAASVVTRDAAQELAAERDQMSDRYADFVAALEWGVNQSAPYPAGTEPFGSQRLEMLKGLLDRLAELGFNGTVRLDSHVGDFCYVTPAPGMLVPAPDDLPAEGCDRIGLSADEARAASARESVAFANFLLTRAAAGAVRIEVVPHGNTMPALPYPAGTEGLTAGEWNAIARQNNRVTVMLLPVAAAR
jgi:CheY-like chemotaxis protein